MSMNVFLNYFLLVRVHILNFPTSAQLQTTLLEREQRINKLSAKALSEEDAEKLQLQEQAQKRLKDAENDLAELKEKLKETRDNWAKARGDAEASAKALDELQSKHKRRWLELTATSEQFCFEMSFDRRQRPSLKFATELIDRFVLVRQFVVT